MGRPRLNLKEQIKKRFNIDEDTGCWVWNSFLTNKGYGKITSMGKTYHAHRLSYEFFKGEIPDGFVLDHLCRNPKCVNPDHLEIVTMRENILRGCGLAAINAQRTHCVNGHEFSGKNTYYRKDRYGRCCKVCRKERSRRYFQKVKVCHP